MANPNIELLTSIANAMGALREQVVFVGGCATGLLISMQLDLVPLDEKILGFANRWYKPGFEAAATATLPSGLVLRLLSAPYFMATKLEAFKDRGNNDVYLSHDLEDVITVVDGREELIGELRSAPPDVRDFVAKTLRGILRHPISPTCCQASFHQARALA